MLGREMPAAQPILSAGWPQPSPPVSWFVATVAVGQTLAAHDASAAYYFGNAAGVGGGAAVPATFSFQ